MSDNHQWAAPGAAEPPASAQPAPAAPAAPAAPPTRQPTPTSPPPPPPGAAPPYAAAPQYAAPQYAAPQNAAPQYAAAPGYAAAQPQGWTPPPKPGLVPLRPLTLGNILGASFQVMRRNPRTTIVPALLLALLTAIAVGGGIALVAWAGSRAGTTTSSTDAGALIAGAFALALLVLVIGGALVLAATAVLQGLIATEIARGAVGERQTFGQAWARTRGRIGAVIGYGLLLVAAIVVAFGLIFALFIGFTAVVATSSTSSSGAAAATGLAVLGLTLLVYGGGAVLWAWLSTKLAFVPSAIVLERLPIRAAIARSWRLTRRAFWRTFGILLLVNFMVGVATNIVATPVQLLAFFGGGLVDPTGVTSTDPEAYVGSLLLTFIASYVVQAFVSSLGMVLVSATGSLLYLDQRMRTEGFDLELSRYVESRAAGADLRDPFLPHAVP